MDVWGSGNGGGSLTMPMLKSQGVTMVRPKFSRCVAGAPGARVFRPDADHFHNQETIYLTLDEFEALRLADYEGLYQEACAARMGISRPTFGRIIATARQKVAKALLFGSSLVIEGGVVHEGGRPTWVCAACDWEEYEDRPPPPTCPRCTVPTTSGAALLSTTAAATAAVAGPGHRQRRRRRGGCGNGGGGGGGGGNGSKKY